MVTLAELKPATGFGFQYSLCRVVLMVTTNAGQCDGGGSFQYSLCRVVLMVVAQYVQHTEQGSFQYSLCRVVLMVPWCWLVFKNCPRLSVLALSSRFDGLLNQEVKETPALLSVLALSSRFDGQKFPQSLGYYERSFSTRSVESF